MRFAGRMRCPPQGHMALAEVVFASVVPDVPRGLRVGVGDPAAL